MDNDKITFLVVDDDPIALEVARERLERLGFIVHTREPVARNFGVDS